MPIDPKREPISRELSPAERAIENEERRAPTEPVLSPAERRVLERIWRRMRLFKPQLYKVFKSWVDALELRGGEWSEYSHGVYRGWYSEQAEKLRLTDNGVKARLKFAQHRFSQSF